ncbi:ATP-binding protein [Minwuia sp.]|uniref:ATP-binding protein n=1 Tax=Minwuia sp. TaxID=2493630 RepID=UPI003A8F8834
MKDFRTRSNQKLSGILTVALVAVFVVLVAVVGGASFWMAAEHDRLASDNTKKLVTSGFDGLESKYRALVQDYALWTELYLELVAPEPDTDWLYANVGSVATVEPSDVDIATVLTPGRSDIMEWRTDGPESPAATSLSTESLGVLNNLLVREPVDSRRGYLSFLEIEGELWIFAAARVVTTEGTPANATDETLPRVYFGRNLSAGIVAGIGEQFLVDDISVGTSPVAGYDHIELEAGKGGPPIFVSWQAPSPGDQILRNIVVPIAIVLLLTGIAIATVALMAVRSARRLEKALVAAQAADRSKTEFLANVSHELRTPMNGVLGMAQVLKMGNLDDRQTKQLGILINSAESQMLIINDLLEISKIENGTFELDNTAFDAMPLFMNIVELQQPAAHEKGIELVFSTPEKQPPKLLGDPQALRQITTNIVGNAVKFTNEGRVDVSVDCATSLDQTVLTLRVRDSGPGIAEEDHHRIFERFAQVDESSTRTAGGTGLGLAITKSLVELMDGTIALESSVGKGSEFTVRLTFEVAAVSELETAQAA